MHPRTDCFHCFMRHRPFSSFVQQESPQLQQPRQHRRRCRPEQPSYLSRQFPLLESCTEKHIFLILLFSVGHREILYNRWGSIIRFCIESKCSIAQFFDTARQGQFVQFQTVIKCLLADFGNGVRNGDVLQPNAGIKAKSPMLVSCFGSVIEVSSVQ